VSTTLFYIILDRYRRSDTFRKISNLFRLDEHAFMLLGVRRSSRCSSRIKRGIGPQAYREGNEGEYQRDRTTQRASG
jgi:acetyl-CoA carboxylase alpha subunit